MWLRKEKLKESSIQLEKPLRQESAVHGTVGQFSWKTSRQNEFVLLMRLGAQPRRACDWSSAGHFSALTASLETRHTISICWWTSDKVTRRRYMAATDMFGLGAVGKMGKMLSGPAVLLSSLDGMRLYEGPWEVSAHLLPRTLHNTWLCNHYAPFYCLNRFLTFSDYIIIEENS